MSLLKQIKKDQITARKEKDKLRATVLTTLYSEAANVGLNDGKRDSTDSEVLAVVKKFLKGINETIDAYDGVATELLMERKIIENYLPKQLTEDELSGIVASIVETIEGATMKDMGKIMGQIKAQYDGQYDGGIASSLVKKALA